MVLVKIFILNQEHIISLHPRMLAKLSEPLERLPSDFSTPYIKLQLDQLDNFDWGSFKIEDIVEMLDLDTNTEVQDQTSIPIYYKLLNQVNMDIIYFCLEIRASVYGLSENSFLNCDGPLAFLCDYFQFAKKVQEQDGFNYLIKHLVNPVNSTYFVDEDLLEDLISFYVKKSTNYLHLPTFYIGLEQKRLIDICYSYQILVIKHFVSVDQIINPVVCVKDMEIIGNLTLNLLSTSS